MKQFLLLCSLSLLLATCKKDNYELPPETQTGAGTFGCKIDGKVWVPRGSNANSGQNIVAYYQRIYPTSNGFVFNFSGKQYQSRNIETVVLSGDSLMLNEGMVLLLGTGLHSSGDGIGIYRRIGDSVPFEYKSNAIYNGEMRLTRFDISNRIASGTFWFDAYDSTSNEIIHVSDGRFDLKFTM